MIISDTMYTDGDYYTWKDKDTGLFIIAKTGLVCGKIVGTASDFEKAKETIEWNKREDKKYES